MAEHKLKGKRVKRSRRGKSKESGFAHYSRLFLEIKASEGLSERTIGKHEENLRYFLLYVEKRLRDASMDEIDREVIRGYIRYMQNDVVKFEGHRFKTEESQTKGLAVSTINTRLKTLRTFFRTMQAEGYIYENPAEGIRNLREPEEPVEVLTTEEIPQLLAAFDQRDFPEFRDYVLTYFLLDSMARINEALRLKAEDFSLNTGEVTIPAHVTKNRKSRTLYLQDRTCTLLAELIRENKADFDDPHVFLNNYGGVLTDNNYRSRLKNAGNRVGIRKNLRPHILRHTAATLFLEDGGDIEHLRMILGHSDMRTVQIYVHLSKRSIRRQQTSHSPIAQITGKLNKKRKTRRN